MKEVADKRGYDFTGNTVKDFEMGKQDKAYWARLFPPYIVFEFKTT